eukprot:6208157-Pleurochrysis_carterae.AAC.1
MSNVRLPSFPSDFRSPPYHLFAMPSDRALPHVLAFKPYALPALDQLFERFRSNRLFLHTKPLRYPEVFGPGSQQRSYGGERQLARIRAAKR